MPRTNLVVSPVSWSGYGPWNKGTLLHWIILILVIDLPSLVSLLGTFPLPWQELGLLINGAFERVSWAGVLFWTPFPLWNQCMLLHKLEHFCLYFSLYAICLLLSSSEVNCCCFFCPCSKPVQTLHSFNVLISDKERLEKKVSDEDLGKWYLLLQHHQYIWIFIVQKHTKRVVPGPTGWEIRSCQPNRWQNGEKWWERQS